MKTTNNPKREFIERCVNFFEFPGTSLTKQEKNLITRLIEKSDKEFSEEKNFPYLIDHVSEELAKMRMSYQKKVDYN